VGADTVEQRGFLPAPSNPQKTVKQADRSEAGTALEASQRRKRTTRPGLRNGLFVSTQETEPSCLCSVSSPLTGPLSSGSMPPNPDIALPSDLLEALHPGRPRQHIAAAAVQPSGKLSGQELHQRLKGGQERQGLSTVYRWLKQLQRLWAGALFASEPAVKAVYAPLERDEHSPHLLQCRP